MGPGRSGISFCKRSLAGAGHTDESSLTFRRTGKPSASFVVKGNENGTIFRLDRDAHSTEFDRERALRSLSANSSSMQVLNRYEKETICQTSR